MPNAAGIVRRLRYPFPFREFLRCVGYRGERKNSHGHPSKEISRPQNWVRRFRAQAEALCATLAALTQPAPAPDFLHRALAMLESTGWIAAHRFLFAGVRCHLLGWPRGLAPDGRRATFSSTAAPA